MWSEDYLVGETPDDADTDAEVAFLVSALALERGARILDVACGAGRHALRLAGAGCQVMGVDASDYLLREAVRHSVDGNPSYVRADMRRLPFRDRFDVALCLFASFGLFGDSGNLATLAALAGGVREQGVVVIESWNALVAADLDGQRNWWRVGDRLYLASATYDPVAGVMHDHRDVIDLETGSQRSWTRSARLYMPPELSIMARASGLRAVQWYGDFDGSPHTPSSPRLIAVFEKASS